MKSLVILVQKKQLNLVRMLLVLVTIFLAVGLVYVLAGDSSVKAECGVKCVCSGEDDPPPGRDLGSYCADSGGCSQYDGSGQCCCMETCLYGPGTQACCTTPKPVNVPCNVYGGIKTGDCCGGGGGCSCNPSCPADLPAPGNLSGLKALPPYDNNPGHNRVPPSVPGYNFAWATWNRLENWGNDGVKCNCSGNSCVNCNNTNNADDAYYQLQIKQGSCAGGFTDIGTATNPASGNPGVNLHARTTLAPGTNYCLRVRAVNPGSDPGGKYSTSCDSTGNWINYTFTTGRLPRVDSVKIFDSSVNGANQAGNIIKHNLWIGTEDEDDNPRRCDGTLVFNEDGITVDCVAGPSQQGWIPRKSDRNPFEVEIDATDPDGVNDMLLISFWMQDTQYPAGGDFAPVNPGYANGRRMNFQFVLGDTYDKQVNGVWHRLPYLDSGPNGSSVVDKQLQSFLQFRGLRFRYNVGSRDPGKGWVSHSDRCTAYPIEWLSAGYNGSNNSVPNPAQNNVDSGCGGNVGRQSVWDVTPNLQAPVICISKNNEQSTYHTWNSCIADGSPCAACINYMSASELDADTIRVRARIAIVGEQQANRDYGLFAYVGDKESLLADLPWDHGGWKLIDSNGNVCNWSGGAWNCNGVGMARVRVDYQAPTGSTSLVEIPPNRYRFIYNQSDMNDNNSGVKAYFGRVVQKQPAGETDWDYLKVKSPASDPQYNTKLNGRSFSNTYASNNVVVGPVEGGDTVRAGLYIYDNSHNARFVVDDACLGDNCNSVAERWMKTSMGDVYSAGGYEINLANSNADTGAGKVEHLVLDKPFRFQRSTLGSFMLYRNLGLNPTGGWDGGPKYQGYRDNYNKGPYIFSSYNDQNNSLVSPNNAAPQASWFNKIKALVNKNKNRLGAEVKESTNIGDLNINYNNQGVKYKVINVSTPLTLSNNQKFVQKNIVFVNGANLTMSRLTATNNNSACLFIVGNNGQITITDNNNTGALNNTIDWVEAGFIVDGGGSFVVQGQPEDTGTDPRDRLLIRGLVFSSSGTGAPAFNRDLVFEDNEQYPAEWIVYDPRFIDMFRDLLGDNEVSQFECGIVQSVECEEGLDIL